MVYNSGVIVGQMVGGWGNAENKVEEHNEIRVQMKAFAVLALSHKHEVVRCITDSR